MDLATEDDVISDLATEDDVISDSNEHIQKILHLRKLPHKDGPVCNHGNN